MLASNAICNSLDPSIILYIKEGGALERGVPCFMVKLNSYLPT